MKQVASLRYGVIFKKAFCDVEIFKAFVKDIVGVELEITQVETEKSFNPVIGQVATKFDLFAEDTKNRIIVDIQHIRYEDHYDRFLHYHCVALLEQIENAQNYRPKSRVFTIVVLTGNDKHETDIAITDFAPRRLVDGKVLPEIQHKIIYLNPKYITDKTPEPYRQWLSAIADSLDENVDETLYPNQIMQHLFQLIELKGISPEERARLFDEYNETTYRQQLKSEGWNEGVAVGMEKGKAEGLVAGVLKGKLETAKAMLAKGIDKQTVMELTGLNAEDIQIYE